MDEAQHDEIMKDYIRYLTSPQDGRKDPKDAVARKTSGWRKIESDRSPAGTDTRSRKDLSRAHFLELRELAVASYSAAIRDYERRQTWSTRIRRAFLSIALAIFLVSACLLPRVVH